MCHAKSWTAWLNFVSFFLLFRDAHEPGVARQRRRGDEKRRLQTYGTHTAQYHTRASELRLQVCNTVSNVWGYFSSILFPTVPDPASRARTETTSSKRKTETKTTNVRHIY